MTRTPATAIAIFFSLTSALVACSSAEEPGDPCEKNPKAKGCKPAAAPASTETTYGSPVPNTLPAPPAPPAAVDAGPPKPDAAPVALPSNIACTDLLRCCWNVQDGIERAACMAVGYKGSESMCVNGLITYTAFGCGHAPVGTGTSYCNDFSNSDRSNGQNDYRCCVSQENKSFDQVACCGSDNAGCRE